MFLLLTLQIHKDGIWVRRLVEELEKLQRVVKVLTLEELLHNQRVDLRYTSTPSLPILSQECSGIINRVSDAADPAVVKRCIALLTVATRLYGIPVFNGPESYSLCCNKWCHHCIFSQAGLASPPTVVVVPSQWDRPATKEDPSDQRNSRIQHSTQLLRDSSLPHLIKPNSGGFGVGIVKLEELGNPDDDDDGTNPLLLDDFNVKQADGTLLLQEYIQSNDNKIYRVWFLARRVQCAVVRTTTPATTNDGGGGGDELTCGCSGQNNVDDNGLVSAWPIPRSVSNEIERMLALLPEDAHAGSVEFVEQAERRLNFDLNLLSTLPNSSTATVADADAIWGVAYNPWAELAKAVVDVLQ